jgi:hypothetical protein
MCRSVHLSDNGISGSEPLVTCLITGLRFECARGALRNRAVGVKQTFLGSQRRPDPACKNSTVDGWSGDGTGERPATTPASCVARVPSGHYALGTFVRSR